MDSKVFLNSILKEGWVMFSKIILNQEALQHTDMMPFIIFQFKSSAVIFLWQV